MCSCVSHPVYWQVCVCGCGADLKGSAILFPELVHELLIGDAVLCLSEGETRFDLPAIMEAHATTDNKQQELADLAYISNLQSQGVLKVRSRFSCQAFRASF